MNQASRTDLVRFLDTILELSSWPDDPSNNGLQFAGSGTVERAVFAVDASAELFRIAAERHADFIFVHHGFSWGSGIRRIDGILADRITTLAKNGISLYAAHLPLDAHPRFGHNALPCCAAGVLFRTKALRIASCAFSSGASRVTFRNSSRSPRFTARIRCAAMLLTGSRKS